MEVNLLDMYPKRDRDTKARLKEKTLKLKAIADKYGWEYFDKKGICYNGYNYDGRWIPIAKHIIKYYGLSKEARILDVGAAKGYLVYDLRNLDMNAYGIDASEYAISCCPDEVKPYMKVKDARALRDYKDKEFDLVISINTIHNLEYDECERVVNEIQRIGKHAFITVDSYRNDYEKERLFDWAITGKTLLSADEWKQMFDNVGYTGDYYWFIV